MKQHILELLPEMMDYARQITEKNSILNKGESSDKEEPHSKVIDHPKQQHVKLVLGYLHRLTHKQKAQWQILQPSDPMVLGEVKEGVQVTL